MSVPHQDTATLYRQFVLGNYAAERPVLVRGNGCRVWDDAGGEYLDFTAGIGVNVLGHCHPRWIAAVTAQAATAVHFSNLFCNPAQGELARRLAGHAGPGRVFFCNSGAEANETLIKLARLHGMKRAGREGEIFKVIAAENAFHGRTFGGMSATPQAKIQYGFAPLVPGFAFAPLNNLEAFARAIDDTTAAVLVETIQGEGGIHLCTPDFLRGLRKLCSERGILLLIDEVQCGIGRSGDFFAYEESEIVPDAIGMAKGLAGGMPIGAIWVAEEYAGLFTPGSHGTTFGGTPLACAAALAVLDVIEEEDLMGNVRRLAPVFRQRLETLVRERPAVFKEIRGRGFMLGLACVEDTAPLVKTLREAGLLVPPAGGNVIRLLPPLNITADDMEECLGILASATA